jgi:putative restriction endonuclease
MLETLDPAEILRRVAGLNVWRRGQERAPHKPLLLLLALGRLSHGAQRFCPYEDWEPGLRQLLEEFGPPRQSVHPEYPFWYLRSDGLWEIEEHPRLTSKALHGDLRRFKIRGGLPEPVYATLRRDPLLVRQMAEGLLLAHFPASIHEEILLAVGLDFESTIRRSRLGSFRSEVLTAYGHACAFCGYDVRLGSASLGLDAAHIMWHQAKGPDLPANGLACCTLHHRALDRGAISLSDDLTILVSALAYGGEKFDHHFAALLGKPLRRPNQLASLPKPEYLDWHRRQVFRPPSRD